MLTTTGDEICKRIAKEGGGTCFLSFSRGKDSLGCWLQLRRYFKRIVPVYMYKFPNLSFADSSLAYYEDYFKTKIHRVPHPALYTWLNNAIYQSPENVERIFDLDLATDYEADDVFGLVADDIGLPRDTWTAVGIRALDSLTRRAAASNTNGVVEKRHVFWPIVDWSNDRLFDELKKEGVKLPADYKFFGRSFDGIHYHFMKPLQRHFPDDYARVLEMFPLADLTIARRAYVGQDDI